MILNGLPHLDPGAVLYDHSFVFDMHNYDRKQLITRYRGTVVGQTDTGFAIIGWQKSIYHFGGLNREVPILVSILLDEEGLIRSMKIDERSEGSQGKRVTLPAWKHSAEKSNRCPTGEAQQPSVRCVRRQMSAPL